MSEPTIDNRVLFRLDPDEVAWLESRRNRMHQTSRNVQAKTELGMWRAVLAAELRRIRLTVGQATCLADIANGVILDPSVGARLGLLYAEVYDAFRLARHADPAGGEVSSYAAKHGIDEQELLNLLAGLGPAADVALRDALARWWQLAEDFPSDADSFRHVGMTVIDSPNEEENTK